VVFVIAAQGLQCCPFYTDCALRSGSAAACRRQLRL